MARTPWKAVEGSVLGWLARGVAGMGVRHGRREQWTEREKWFNETQLDFDRSKLKTSHWNLKFGQNKSCRGWKDLQDCFWAKVDLSHDLRNTTGQTEIKTELQFSSKGIQTEVWLDFFYWNLESNPIFKIFGLNILSRNWYKHNYLWSHVMTWNSIIIMHAQLMLMTTLKLRLATKARY